MGDPVQKERILIDNTKMQTILFSEVFIITLVCGVYLCTVWLYRKTKLALLHPLLVSIPVLIGVMQMLDAVQQVGEISTAVLCGGFKVTLIPTAYGMIIYMISLIIHISEKARI